MPCPGRMVKPALGEPQLPPVKFGARRSNMLAATPPRASFTPGLVKALCGESLALNKARKRTGPLPVLLPSHVGTYAIASQARASWRRSPPSPQRIGGMPETGGRESRKDVGGYASCEKPAQRATGSGRAGCEETRMSGLQGGGRIWVGPDTTRTVPGRSKQYTAPRRPPTLLKRTASCEVKVSR